MPEITPQTALEVAGAIVAFCRSLTDDQKLLYDSLRIATDAISADLMAEARRQSSSPTDR